MNNNTTLFSPLKNVNNNNNNNIKNNFVVDFDFDFAMCHSCYSYCR